MTDYPQKTKSEEASVPLYPNPQVPLTPMPQAPPLPRHPMPQAPPLPLNPMPQIPLGHEPCMVTCPSCGASIRTKVTLQAGTHTHLMALLLCLLCVCAACIPYCVDSCQNADHHCPNCDAYLGTHKI